VTTGGPPVGLFPDARYEEESADLVAGDRVVVVTDGITERMPTDLGAAVARLDGHLSADAMCGSIFLLSQSPDAANRVAGWADAPTVLVIAVD
jgi:serine phosphatase RsbU (regulator of sigma subunit)